MAHDQMMGLHMRLLVKHGLHKFDALLVCVQVGQRVEGVGCIIQPVLSFSRGPLHRCGIHKPLWWRDAFGLGLRQPLVQHGQVEHLCLGVSIAPLGAMRSCHPQRATN